MTDVTQSPSQTVVHTTGRGKGLLAVRYEENPFTVNGTFQVPVRNGSVPVDTAGPLAVITDQGEVVETAQIRMTKAIDTEKFVKVYVAQLNAFFDLKPGTLKVLTVIMEGMTDDRKFGTSEVYLNYNACRRFFERYEAKPVSKPTFYSALEEMISKGMIAPSVDQNLWFCNPAIFFTGDRVRFVTELRKKRMTKQEALEADGQQRLQLENETKQNTD